MNDDDSTEERREEEQREDSEEERSIPETSLEFEFAITNPEWGETRSISPALREALSKYKTRLIRKGEVYVNEGTVQVATEDTIETRKVYLWDQLDFITRDLRLANIDNDELRFITHYLDLAHDCLNEGLLESAAICIERAATRLELSQSKKGFLRKNYRERRLIKDTRESKDKNSFRIARRDE